MGLLGVPAVPLGPLASSAVIGATNQRIGDAVCEAKGMVFAATNSGINPEQIYRWQSKYHPETYDTVTPGSFFAKSLSGCAIDLVNDCIYWGCVLFDGGSNTNQVTVVKTGIESFTDGGEVVPQTSLSAAAFNDIGQNSAICTDSTYIYVLANDLAMNSYVGKFAISDGSLVTALQLGNPPSGTSKGGSVIAFGGDGFVYCAGSFSNLGWVAKVDVALGGATVVNVPVSIMNDDTVLDASFMWVGDEDTGAPGNLVRVARDLSGSTAFTTGVEGWIDCVYQDPYDATRLWLVQNYSRPSGLTSASALVCWDKTNGVVVPPVIRTSLLFDLNEIFRISNAAFFGVTFNAIAASRKCLAGVIPITADPGLTARPPAGRGAGW